jgi:nitrate/nitrite transport system substrate-binding protein
MKAKRSQISRRQFLKRSGGLLGATALLSGLPAGWVGQVFASESPEVTNLRMGFIALTDCSPMIIAHEKGFFKKYGIQATLAKGANWAAIRDSLSSGDIQATHMLLGMPLASTMGLAGSPKKPMVIPWILNTSSADAKPQQISKRLLTKGAIRGSR